MNDNQEQVYTAPQGVVAQMPRRRVWIFRLVALTLAMIVAALVLEVGIRLFAPQATRFFAFEDFNSPDGRLRPGAGGLLCGASVTINSYGERGPVYSKRKPPGVYRICVLGDSVVFGLGVEDDLRYARLLEGMLRARVNRANIEVVPLAKIAYRLSGYRERLLGRALEFQPDLIVLGFLLNDFDKPPADWTESSPLPQVEASRKHGISGSGPGLLGELCKRSHLAYLVRKVVHSLLWIRIKSPEELISRWKLESMYPESPEFKRRWVYTVAQLDAIVSGCRAQRVDVVLTVTPYDVQMNTDRLAFYRRYLPDLPDSCLDDIPQGMLRAYARQRGVLFVDFTQPFRTHPSKVFFETLEGRVDVAHPNAEGHRVMAQTLADAVAPLLDSRLPE